MTIETPAQRDKRGRALAQHSEDLAYLNATEAGLSKDQRKMWRPLYLRWRRVAGIRPSVDGALEDMRIAAAKTVPGERTWRT